VDPADQTAAPEESRRDHGSVFAIAAPTASSAERDRQADDGGRDSRPAAPSAAIPDQHCAFAAPRASTVRVMISRASPAPAYLWP
jgi:hypothetical protein